MTSLPAPSITPEPTFDIATRDGPAASRTGSCSPKFLKPPILPQSSLPKALPLRRL